MYIPLSSLHESYFIAFSFSVLCGILLFLCFIGTVIDLIDETFDNSLIPWDPSNNGTGQNYMSIPHKMTQKSIPNSSIEVNDIKPTASSTVDDVVLFNHSRFSVKCHYIVTAFKGINIYSYSKKLV